jgi:N-acyl-D-amino-acid deacylase
MTGKPAQVFHVEKRGRLQEGYFADLVVFDPERIIDIATAENPYQYPLGIHDVVVNGSPVLLSGRFSGIRSGRVLRRKQSWLPW